MNRQECLDEALVIVHADRSSNYGEPEDNFGDIAAYWTTYLRKKLKRDIFLTTADVAIMSALIKVSRLQNTPGHEDSWIDLAGYAACGAQCATEVKEPESLPILMMCGCPLTIKNLVERGSDLYCANCGYEYKV
ncbi:hypothetical protein KAR91_10130 [Candidatus Pacearchaeota archaeon]|nr:hypothetical protein [Candidatus Pacearchaeota archaeon]